KAASLDLAIAAAVAIAALVNPLAEMSASAMFKAASLVLAIAAAALIFELVMTPAAIDGLGYVPDSDPPAGPVGEPPTPCATQVTVPELVVKTSPSEPGDILVGSNTF